MTLRNRRMDTEWQMFETLANANKATFASITRAQDEFHILMRESPAWVGAGNERHIETEHALRYVYPRYYPSLPLEGYFVRPILHVNVDPETGFVCLWKDCRPAQTIIDAILITRTIMACKTANFEPGHRMQHNAFFNDMESCVLPMPSLKIPENCLPLLPHRSSRQRLSSEFHEQKQERDFCVF
jgi:ubiquitin-protein ligase